MECTVIWQWVTDLVSMKCNDELDKTLNSGELNGGSIVPYLKSLLTATNFGLNKHEYM